jgi:hypothetical protein
LIVCSAFLSAYTVYKHIAQERVLTPFFIIALTQAEERESYR